MNISISRKTVNAGIYQPRNRGFANIGCRLVRIYLAIVLSVPYAVAVSGAADEEVTATVAQDEAAAEQPLQSPNEILLNMSSRYFTAAQFEIEVAGFRLMRRDVVSSTIGIPDLDLALNAEGERMIPLARMLIAFGIKILGDDDVIRIQAEYAPAVEIDLKNQTISFDGASEPLNYLAGISEITNSREIYLLEATLARIFNLEIIWEDDLYEYLAVTDELLKIWHRKSKAYTGHEAELVKDDLPELFGPARPSKNSLDYVQTRLSADISAGENDDTRASINTAQDFWGGLWGGRYQLRFQQPNISWEDGQGFDSGEQSLSVPRYASWAKIFDKNEVTVGDSNFAINELALPFIDFTGARINGVLGTGSDDINELSSFNIEGSFIETRRFDGEAELGSEVKLFINDSEVATAEVYEEADSPVGFGRYEFDEVSIPSGNLVAIRIEITEPGGSGTEPGGRRVVRDLSTVNTPNLRPAGQLSYVGGVGTVRDETEWDNNGLIGGARLLYGVNSRLTLGATVGHQKNASSQFASTVSVGTRSRADESDHLGLELVVNPFSTVVLSASAASSDGSREGSVLGDKYEGDAYTLSADYTPHRQLKFFGRAYRYEPGFFNGVDVSLQDREGYYVSAEGRFSLFRATADYGMLEDNVENDNTFTMSSDYYGLRLSSDSLIPYAYIFVEYDEVAPENFDSKSITTSGLRTKLFGFNIDASLTEGNLFGLDPQVRDLFQNIALPNIRITGSPSSSLAVSRALGNHRVALEFDGEGTDIDQRSKLTHYWDSSKSPGGGFFGGNGLRVVTELSYDKESKEESILNRVNWYLDSRRRNRVGMITTYDAGRGWSWRLDFNLTNVFALRSGRIVNVSAESVNPSYGGTSGMVFLDSNANGVRDEGEKGVQNIRISSSDAPHGTYTDRYGEFYMSRRANQNESVVYVDIESVPATMIPVHARQIAILEKGLTSRAEFALAPMVSLTGLLMSPEIADKKSEITDKEPEIADKELEIADKEPEIADKKNEMKRKPMSGVRIELTDLQGRVVGESITATDGSYFFNAIPGDYQLWVDPQTVHPMLIFNEPAFTLKVAGVEEYQELEFEPIYAQKLNKGGVSTVTTTSDGVHPNSVGSAITPDADPVEPVEAAGIAGDGNSEVVPLDLTRPKVHLDTGKQGTKRDFIGITHKIKGQFLGQNSSGPDFSPIAGARMVLLDVKGDEIDVAITAADGIYHFEVPAGRYTIVIDPLSVPLHFVYDEPALSLNVLRKETSQRIKLKTIYANYLELVR